MAGFAPRHRQRERRQRKFGMWSGAGGGGLSVMLEGINERLTVANSGGLKHA